MSMSGVEQKRFEGAGAWRTGRLGRQGAGMRARRAVTLHRKTCPERKGEEKDGEHEAETRFHCS